MAALNVGDASTSESLPPITLPDHMKSTAVQQDALTTAAASDADRAREWRVQLEKAWMPMLEDLYVSTPQEYAKIESEFVAALEARGYTLQRVTPDNYNPPPNAIHMFDSMGNPKVPTVQVIIGGEYMSAWGWRIAPPGEWQFEDKLLSLDGLRMALLVDQRDRAIDEELRKRLEARAEDRARQAREQREAYENSDAGRIERLEAQNEALRQQIERLLQGAQ